MYFDDFKISLVIATEEIYSKNFLIRQVGVGIITESLIVILQGRLIDITDIHIQTDKF